MGGCLKGSVQQCASNCCNYQRDRFGFPDNNISDPTKSTRKDYVYKYECYTGLGAFNKLAEDAMKNVLNLGGIGKNFNYRSYCNWVFNRMLFFNRTNIKFLYVKK